MVFYKFMEIGWINYQASVGYCESETIGNRIAYWVFLNKYK